MSRLWDTGRSVDEAISRFTVGLDPQLDLHLVAYDALASAAHATMLQRIGVLQAKEHSALVAELAAIAADARCNAFTIENAQEDCHTAIENRLTEKLGDAGRRIHTGRSRNDQVIAALRLFGRAELLAAAGELLDLVAVLVELAEQHRDTAVPGYTHTRQAMPSTLGLLFGAHAEGLLDTVPWVRTAFAHVNRSPLGSASGYGVALPLDRQLVADLLCFDAVQPNVLAVQNDRGRTEFAVLGAMLTPLLDLGRLATDLIWFSSQEFGFIGLDEAVTTGSSIMPQKRNPDVLELVRATAARMQHQQAEVGAIYSRLTSGYHRDLQLTKAPFVEGMATARDVFVVMRRVLSTLTVDKARCEQALVASTGATDEVYRRVAQGEPFRSAYQTVAADPVGTVTVDATVAWCDRQHLGAPGALDMAAAKLRLDEARAWVQKQSNKIAPAWRLLGE